MPPPNFRQDLIIPDLSGEVVPWSTVIASWSVPFRTFGSEKSHDIEIRVVKVLRARFTVQQNHGVPRTQRVTASDTFVNLVGASCHDRHD